MGLGVEEHHDRMKFISWGPARRLRRRLISSHDRVREDTHGELVDLEEAFGLVRRMRRSLGGESFA